MEMGKPPMQAAFDGSKEVAFTILSMTVSLAAVFIPVLFMGGIVGRLLHEFAVTISVAILVSGFVSISLTPMLCSRFLKPPHAQKHGAFYNATERMFELWLQVVRRDAARRAALPRGDDGRLGRAADRHRATCSDRCRRASCRARIRGASTSAPRRCRASASTRWPATSSQVAEIVAKDPDVAAFSNNVGGGPRGGDAEQRAHLGRAEAARRAQRQRRPDDRGSAAQAGAGPRRPRVPDQPAADQPRRTRGGTAQPVSVHAAGHRHRRALPLGADPRGASCARSPGLEDVSSDLQIKNPQIRVEMDRDKISALGLTVEPGGDRALQRLRHAPGVADLRAEQSVPGHHAGGAGVPEQPGGAVDALRALERRPADPAEYGRPREDRRRPVGHCAHRPAAVGHHLVQPEARLSPSATRSRRSSRPRPPPFPRPSRTTFQGTAQAFQDSLQGLGLILLMAIVVIYIVLGILYESFTHPLTILSGLPAAGFGALLTLLIFKTELSLYAFVGVIMLVGLVKKNGIMMVDFAVEAQRAARQDAARGDPRSVSGALPADHDDDDGGAGRHAADRARLGRRRRVAAAARPRGGRRPAGVAAADAVHHAGLLRVHRECADVAGQAAVAGRRSARHGASEEPLAPRRKLTRQRRSPSS